MTFFSQDYLKPQHFSAQTLHGALAPVEESARSGYWRLFFTQMQEEALKKRDKIPTVEQEKALEQVEGQATPQRARKSKKRKLPVVELEQFPEVRFKRKPIYANITPVAQDFPLWLSGISQEINSWFSQIIPLWESRRQVIISTQKAAANDAEYRTRLLLLMAA